MLNFPKCDVVHASSSRARGRAADYSVRDRARVLDPVHRASNFFEQAAMLGGYPDRAKTAEEEYKEILQAKKRSGLADKKHGFECVGCQE